MVAFAITALVSGLIAGLAGAAGSDSSDPRGIDLLSLLVQDVALVSVAVFFASRVGSVSLRDFGLRAAPIRRAAVATIAGLAIFYIASVAYAALVSPDGEQDIVQDLGAKDSTALLIGSAVLVVGLAPFAEELFFRGFFYRALRNRFSVWIAVALVAALFGIIHYRGPDTLPLLPLLALLGAIFCLVYERTGSLWPAIAIHTINNALAFAVAVGTATSVVVSAAVAVGGLMVCVVGLVRTSPRPSS